MGNKMEAYNCLHMPHGEAAGLMSVATAMALKSLWPATCLDTQNTSI